MHAATEDGPGQLRVRAVGPGRAGRFLDKDGNRITDPDEIERIKSLAIPPAWQDVWISPYPNGHIQAVGTDDAGRRQYLYHPDWRIKRDKMKFDRVLAGRAASCRPPGGRSRATSALDGMPLERADAVAVRLLDLGYFRIGSDIYADTNGSLRPDHAGEAARRGSDEDMLVFRFEGKSGIEHSVEIDDPEVLDALDSLRRRRGGTERLLAYQLERRWRDLDSAAVNIYLGGLLEDLTAKDFRTWHATVHRGRRARRLRGARGHQAVAPAGDQGRRRGGRGVPRQHPDDREELLHRPARDRPLRERHHHRPRRS